MTLGQRLVMKTRIAFLSAVLAMPLVVAAADAVAAWIGRRGCVRRHERRRWPQSLAGPSRGQPGGHAGQLAEHSRARGGADGGPRLASRLSLELTGSAREPESDQRRSWSALAVARGVITANATSRHALTVAGGPFVEFGNAVHGTLPFAHAELAYVYRSPFGLTVLAGGGAELRARDLVLCRTAADLVPATAATPSSGASTSVPTRRRSTRETGPPTCDWPSAGSSDAAASGPPANPGLNREGHAPRLWLLCWRCP